MQDHYGPSRRIEVEFSPDDHLSPSADDFVILRRRCIITVIVLALIAMLFAMTGCNSPGKASTSAPAAKASITEEHYTLNDAGKPIAKTVTTRTGEATGTGTAASGDNISGGMESEPASVEIAGVKATGGGGDSWSKAMAFTGGIASNPLLWVGVACLLAAAVAFWQGWKSVVLPAVGAGIVFIAIALYPEIIVWALVGLTIIVGGPYLYTAWSSHRSKEALRAVVAGVEASPPSAQEAVKDEISKQADAADKTTIMKVKLKDNL